MTMVDLEQPSVIVLNGLKENTYYNVVSFEIWETHNLRLIFEDDDDLIVFNVTNMKVK